MENNTSSTTSMDRRSALGLIGAASVGLLGASTLSGEATTQSISSSGGDETFQDHAGGRQTTFHNDGSVIGEFHSKISGPTNVGTDNEVQMAPSLTHRTNDDPFDTKAWVLTRPRLTFTTVSEPPAGDAEITNVETHLHSNGASRGQSPTQEQLTIDYTQQGGQTQSAWWLVNFGGQNPRGTYNFNMTAKMNWGYWEKDRVRPEYHHIKIVKHKHPFSITVS